jgi:serine/threonine protein kinase
MPYLLRDIVDQAISRAGLAARVVSEDGPWCGVAGSAAVELVQGWKLHVSATPLSAPVVLHAAAQVLLSHGCRFKFAKDLDTVVSMTGIHCDRAQAGKFITAYPADEEEFHRVAVELCDATVGLPGPRILSDRQYRPGSIVQYRFGAFTGVPFLSDDGLLERRLRDPSGKLVVDERKPWFTPPHWITPIVPRGVKPAPTAVGNVGPGGTPSRPVLADGRFEVLRALRHSARGGVYQAIDTKTGRPVLIKEARANIGADRRGKDSRALLAYESRVLAELSPLTPAVISLFHKDDHTFLVEEFVDGQSMTRHIMDAVRIRQTDVARPGRLALALVKLVDEAHDRGWVLRDLSSSNIMVTPDSKLILIDPEYAARRGDVVAKAYTPGFVAPEILDASTFGFAPDPAADRFAVGTILIHLLLGAPAYFMADPGTGHTVPERIRRLLVLAGEQKPLIRRWWPLLTGLCNADPDSRWTLAQAADFLRSDQDRATNSDLAPPGSTVMPSQLEGLEMPRVLQDGLDYLLTTLRPEANQLWETDDFGATTDPLNVQYGAAGILPVLVRAAGHGHPEAAAALPVVAEWMRERLDRTPRLLPGLYFGRAGAAWALREVADVLDDAELAWQVEEFGLRLPVRWHNPDVCHGAAGAGFSQLRLWQLSGRGEFLDRVRDCADGLLDAACDTEDGVFWPARRDSDSSVAGAWHFGFAHGVAGVGAFLLAAGQACGDTRYLDLANAAGRTLAAACDINERTGAATWRTERERCTTGTEMLFHWCSGASGIGTFLLRLAVIQPDETAARQYRELVHGAAIAVHQARWISSTATCHGLAGNGQFLLDAVAAAEQAGSPAASQYRAWAEDLATALMARQGLRGGRMVIPEQSGTRVTAGYGTGLAGVLDFLLRLRHGGERSWMVELSGQPSLCWEEPSSLVRR